MKKYICPCCGNEEFDYKGFTLAPETVKLARSIKDQYQYIPKERVEQEFKKLVQKGVEPGAALQYLYDTGWSENFPHIHNLRGVEQEPEYHPEGDVDVHTAHVMNAAAQIADREGITGEDREVLIYAALAHDFAKPATTKTMVKKGIPRITSHGHEEAGGPMARHFLESIGVNKRIIDKVVPLVENHLKHINFSHSPKQDSFVKQLAERMHPSNIKELTRLIEADHSGRPPLPQLLPNEAAEMANKAQEHSVLNSKHQDLLQGKDILQYTGGQGGPMVGKILKEHRNLLLNDNLRDRDSALNWLETRMQKEATLINGNDIMSELGVTGPDIKNILDKSWRAQRNGEFNDKQSALDWLRSQSVV